MTLSTISPKNQTTLSARHLKSLRLRPGTRLKQWVENGRIILEPVEDVFTAFGALKAKRPFVSIEVETAAMEKAVSDQVMHRKRKS
jgi:hypothetical protein